MADHHEEEVLGKAYDARLMRRLLRYLWPYKWHALTALVLTMGSAPLVLAGAPLTKAAIDLFLDPSVRFTRTSVDPDAEGRARISSYSGDEEFLIEASKLDPNLQYTVIVDGHYLDAFTTGDSGDLRIQLSNEPNSARPLPALLGPLNNLHRLEIRDSSGASVLYIDELQPAGVARILKHLAERFGFGASPYQGIVFISIVFLIANIAAFAVQYTQAIVMQAMGQYIMYDLRKQIFAHLQRLSVQFYDHNPVGRLMTRLTTDVDALNEMFTAGVIAIFGDLAMIFYIVIWMFQVNWQLALVSFAILPLLIALTTWFRLGARSSFRSVRVRIARINAFLQEHITGMPVVQLFNREEKEMRKFDEINEAHRKANIDTIFYYAVFYPAVEIIGSIGIGLIIWYGGGQVVRGIATIGTLVAFIQLARSFYEPISDISEKYNILQSAMASSERIFKLLDEPVTIASPEKHVPIGRATGQIEFRNVWFAYKDDDWILKDVSFTVSPGERVAFVGHTGAGKTTITSLLLRFYDIQRGQILIDGVDIRKLDLEELRANFSIVLQDVFLFSGDIAANIRLGNRAITDEQLQEASRQVHADQFVKRLPEGYAAELRERGAGLSVGQKQLISFARALAFDPRVLILDEATSSIDTETEILIRDAVERLMEGRTSLVIAHRLSTIQSVDKIIVMHKGEIRETGTHQDLLAERGLYWRLYQLQFYQDYKQKFAESVADD
ncbi:MAG TPA: ABC transporter ATP-binding protein [Blastocatellia bacterium]|nr:ABC transporter ATP-binding protein [Blastocatellia bacterium]